ncbi:origin recognition complex subunit 4 [Malassezia sp. CBS 17886]|nr:origin recognition complex subunit 4 [Malassezia sp. CBS 17886]
MDTAPAGFACGGDERVHGDEDACTPPCDTPAARASPTGTARTRSSAVCAQPPAAVAACLPAQQARILQTLSTALPPATEDAPYCGQECIGLSEPWNLLYSLVQSTVQSQEGNSCLLVGAHGSGKSLLVQSVLREIERETPQHARPYVVGLSALLHTTDRQCLAAMAKQLMAQGALGRQEVAAALVDAADPDTGDADMPDTGIGAASWRRDDDSDDEMPAAAPPPADAPPPDAVANAILSTMSTTLLHILTLLSHTPEGHAAAHRPLIVLLDQFDIFAKRPRQALLYCLLDAVQAASYGPGLVVIGMAARVDASDFLEKRVKSRFSHRIFHLRPPAFDQYVMIARAALLGAAVDPAALPPAYTSGQRREIADTGDTATACAQQAFLSAWRTDIDDLIQSAPFHDFLRGLHDLSADVRLLYQAMTPAVAALTCERPMLDTAAFAHAAAARRTDPVYALLLELSDAETAILVAARHLQLRENEPFTFEMAFHELAQFVQRTQRDLDSGADSRLRSRGAFGLAMLHLFADRRRMLQTFYQLLAQELLLPESSRLSLALPAGAAARTGPATSAYGVLPSATVIPEYLPVRTVVPGKALLESTRDASRVVPLNSLLLKWAESSGM